MTAMAARTQTEIIDLIVQIRSRLKKTPPANAQAERDNYTFINGLVWAAGGCVNPYHPPECHGDMGVVCTNPKHGLEDS
jgi:hypothetical protein